MSLEPLRGLTELRTLYIQSDSDTAALSLAPLSGLTKLTELNINSCSIQNGDLSALSGLTELRTLQVYHREWVGNDYNNRVYIRDLSPLSELTKLNSLTISGTAEGIDTSPVSYVSNLEIR